MIFKLCAAYENVECWANSFPHSVQYNLAVTPFFSQVGIVPFSVTTLCTPCSQPGFWTGTVVDAEVLAGLLEVEELAGLLEVDELAGLLEVDELAGLLEAEELADVLEAEELAGLLVVEETAGVVEAEELADVLETPDEVEAGEEVGESVELSGSETLIGSEEDAGALTLSEELLSEEPEDVTLSAGLLSDEVVLPEPITAPGSVTGSFSAQPVRTTALAKRMAAICNLSFFI